MKYFLSLSFFCISLFCSAQSKIIGIPIRINNIEVSQFTFPNSMNWIDAIDACVALGSGWKLPSKHQLDTLYKYKEKIGGFVNDAYWSSTKSDDYNAWRQYFSDGDQVLSQTIEVGYVRAIRELNLSDFSKTIQPLIKKDSQAVSQSGLADYEEIPDTESDWVVKNEIIITNDTIRETLAPLDDGPVRVRNTEDAYTIGRFSEGKPFENSINTASDKRYYSQSELKELLKPVNIIGKPIKIGNILVAQNEFPIKANWANAVLACRNLGNGWRLPTKDELHLLYQNKNKLGNFSKYGYWSSSEGDMEGVAWFQDFYLTSKKPSLANKLSTWGVRAVKSL